MASKQIPNHFPLFSVNIDEIMIFLDSSGENSVKLARETRKVLFYLSAFLSLLEKLESLLDRLNMPMLLDVNAESKETSSELRIDTWNLDIL